MNKPFISIIAAIDEARGIGHGNKLLWNIPQDLKRFRDITRGHACIMGRKTYESIGHPLPNRTNIVISRQSDFHPDGVIVTSSIKEAIEKAGQTEKSEIFIIGGAQIYALGLPFADRLYLTMVKGVYRADTFFPEYEKQFTKVIEKETGQSSAYSYTFITLERMSK